MGNRCWPHQYEEGLPEDVTLTSIIKDVGSSVYKVSTLEQEGNFPAVEILEYGLADEGVDISDSTQHLTPEILEAIENYKEQIISGEIVVPTVPEN